jgi:hypothetical protein
MSGSTEAASRSGRFTLTLAIFEEPFPVMYPKAKWPIANVQKTSWVHRRYKRKLLKPTPQKWRCHEISKQKAIITVVVGKTLTCVVS